MNDWDNLDNFPADDDDNEDFGWLNEDSEDSDSSGDDNDLSWMSDSDDEDVSDNDADESDGLDMPDWLSGMELPDVSDDEIAAAQQSISADADDSPDTSDDWGVSDADDDDGDDDLSWMSGSDDSGDNSADTWGVSDDSDDDDNQDWMSGSDDSGDNSADTWGIGDSTDEAEIEGDSWLASTDDTDDEVDDFLFGASSDDDDDDSEFLFGAESDDDDSDDDLSWMSASDDDDNDDSGFLLGAEADDDDSDDDLSWMSASDDDDDSDDFSFGSDDSSEEVDASQDSGGWGDLGDFDFEEDESSQTEPVAEDSDWGISESDDDDFDFLDEPAASASSVEDDDLGTPDWLSDMPVPGEDPADVPGDDDLGVPDWLSDMPVPGEEPEVESPVEDDLAIPEWLEGSEPVAESVGDSDDLMDLFGELADEPVAESAGDNDDLLDLLGDFDDVDGDDLSDLLATLDDGEDDGDLDDLLSSLDSTDDSGGLDDLFASLDEPVTETDDDLDFLMEDTVDADDLDFLEPVAETGDDLDFLMEDTVDADDLDFLEPVAETDDDLDFLMEDTVDADNLDFLEPVAKTDDDLDFLMEDTVDADNLDFLEPVAEVSDDLDFLNYSEDDQDSDEDSELELLNLLNRRKTGELGLMDDVSLEESTDDTQPELDDEELAILNQLSQQRTADLGFMDGVSRQESADDTQPEINDEELAILNQLSQQRTADLGFMDGISREESADDTQPEIDDEELSILNQLSQQRTGDLDFMQGVSRDPNSAFDMEEEDLNLTSDELDFMSDIAHDTGELQSSALQSGLDSHDDYETADDVQALLDAHDLDNESSDTGTLSFLDQVDDNPDWLDEISGIDTDTLKLAAAKANEPEKVDIDSLIDTFDFDDARNTFADEEEIVPGASLDSIFDEMDADEATDGVSDEALPEWLQEIQKGELSESAAGLLRERRNRSLDDLDDRLLDLRERGLEMSPDVSDEPESKQRLAKVVPNLDEALSPARFSSGQSAISTTPDISPEQAKRAEMLQNLVGTSLGRDEETDRSQPRQQGESLLKSITKRADRFIIALLLVAAVIVPFAYPVFGNIGILPAGEFAEDSAESIAFTTIENLTPGEYVLIATEYGATGARELDTATQSLLEHVITKGGIPVLVGSDAVGLLRAENILNNLLGEGESNHGFYVAGLLPGGNIGLRDFAGNVSAIVSNDLRGNPTGLELSSLDDFATIIIISESGENVRNWMEQIAPVTRTGIIVVTGQAARPLALPYVTSSDNVIALLTGYEDAFTYQQMALAIYNPSDTPAPSQTMTSTATGTPLPTATPLPTDTPTETPLPTDTAIPSDTPEATDRPPATATGIPSLTPRPTNTPGGETDTPVPTNTALPTNTLEPTSTTEPVSTLEVTMIEVAVVSSTSAANVRAGAGTNFNIVSTVNPGDQLAVRETSLDEEWYEVILPDGSSGWLAAILVDITEIPSNEFEGVLVSSTVQIGTVIGDGRVNIRSGAGSEFDAVAGLDPNSQVRIIGTNDAGDWYNIVLPNGGTGWIASFLLTVQEIPEDEWQGASKNGYYPVFFSRPPEVAQGNAEDDTLLIGRNASNITAPVYVDADQSSVLIEIPNGTEFILIEEAEPFSQILLADGQIGFIETRLIVTEERLRSEVDFAPTVTPTPLPPTVTPTFTPTPFEPQITPAPLIAPETRSSSQALGLLAAIMVIALGNLFWIFRWLGQREQ